MVLLLTALAAGGIAGAVAARITMAWFRLCVLLMHGHDIEETPCA